MSGARRLDDPAARARLLRGAALADTGWVVTASGRSMEPAIGEGSEIRVRALGRRPRIGEVWAFVDASNHVIVHRYLRRTRHGRFVFAGDAAAEADAPVRRDWLIGAVVEVRSSGEPRRVRRSDSIRPVLHVIGRGVARRLGMRRRQQRRD